MEMPSRMRWSPVAGLCLFALALVLMRLSVPGGVTRESVSITGPGGKPCLGTLWKPPSPKAIMLIGHGVTSNQGIMATTAKAFAANGYTAVTLDFWGHGRSEERFDWRSNPGQLKAWFAWAHTLGSLPVAYLGHSMGGFSGAEALADESRISAFVSLGALPPEFPPCRTLVAAGRFEELFNGAEARAKAGGRADVIISPFSDHSLEPFDPVLLKRIVAWVDGTLGFPGPARFPWGRWACALLGTVLGCVSAFWLAGDAAGTLPRQECPIPVPIPAARRWSVNPYRLAGRLLGCTGTSAGPRSGSFGLAVRRGVVFSAVLALLLPWVLDRHIFTSDPGHWGRLLTWCIFAPFLLPLFMAGAWALERVGPESPSMRFAMSALTRCVPLLLLSAALFAVYPKAAFGSMILCIWAFIFAVLSAVHAMVTQRTGDWRAGAVASAVTLAWTMAFWFPLSWPWIW